MSTRFSPEAADRFRQAIREAGGIELFAIGRVDASGHVVDLDVHCCGTADAVPALLSRPRPGEVVIHNHPSGVVEASGPDMRLASLYGEDGVGVVIVDNEVRRALWVVEPLRRRYRPVDPAQVEAFFRDLLPQAIGGHEARPGQVEMALRVTEALNAGEEAETPVVSVLEAGTGTGKSLAYLVPAVLWATANEAKVAVATFTISLQAQLVSDDIPIVRRAGIPFRHALLKGRNNYVCRRKLAEALQNVTDAEAKATLEVIDAFVQTAADGTKGDLAFPLDDDTWDLVGSDHDQTLRARCPHYDRCFYYQARREAAAAHLLVVNHHLLLADVAVKTSTGGEGILPRFDRLVLDEAHHLEDAATSLLQARVTARAMRQALAPLLPRRGAPGSFATLDQVFAQLLSPLCAADREEARRLLAELQRDLPEVHQDARGWMEQLAVDGLDPQAPTLRVTSRVRSGELWQTQLEPTIRECARRLGDAARRLASLEELLDGVPPEDRLRSPQAFFDLGRARRRLGELAGRCTEFVASPAGAGDEPQVRWMDRAYERGAAPSALLALAPIEVGPILRAQLFESMKATVLTSATLTVHGRFDHLLERLGLDGQPSATGAPVIVPRTATLPSPFDYAEQALLGIPRDLPTPGERGWEEAVARVVSDAVVASGGGVFVLCTSFQILRFLHERATQTLGERFPLFRQGEMGRHLLLERFRQAGNGVLFGTDSFWEGVSVKGAALRLVIIPRLPFRVPTEPVQQARHERIEARGGDPFRAYSLPQAVLRLRQGLGRLIRTRADRGAVLVLDRRVVDRWYGRVFLASLPPMRRVSAPWRVVLAHLARLYSG